MAEKKFVRSMIEVATELKGASITSAEENLIIKTYNTQKGTPYEKAKASIEGVIGKKFPEKSPFLIEKAASLNNLQNLLSQMSNAANEWQNTQNK